MNPETILTLIFITLKLTNHIDWSWFLVLSPIIFRTLVIVGILAFIPGARLK